MNKNMQDARAKRINTRVKVEKLSRANFVATNERPQNSVAKLKATYAFNLKSIIKVSFPILY